MKKIDVKQTTVKLLKEMNLSGNKEVLINSSLKHICSLNAEQIVDDFENIAALFCLSAKHMTEEMLSEPFIHLLDSAFNNIKRKELDINGNGNSVIIYFLGTLNDFDPSSDANMRKIVRELFEKLCSDLEGMRVLFKAQLNDRVLFPIGKLLNYVITDTTFLRGELDDVTFNTLLLAMEIFQTASYAKERQTVNDIIKRCNLQCLSYLEKRDTIKLGGDSNWKKNLKNNGVLGLIIREDSKNKIYIRHADRSYFGSRVAESQLGKEYNNSREKVIAYYYERECSNDIELFSFDKIFERKVNSKIKNAFKLMFQDKAYNIFLDNSLILENNQLWLTNPFTMNDNGVITHNGAMVASNLDNLTNRILRPYCFDGFGDKFDIVMYGSIVKLLKLDANAIDDIFDICSSSKGDYQNQVIITWAGKLKSFLDTIKQLVDLYYKDIGYIRNQNTLQEEKIAEVSWLPMRFPIEVIDNYLKLTHGIGSDNKECLYVSAKQNFMGDIHYYVDEVEYDIKESDFGDNKVISEGNFYIVSSCNGTKFQYICEVDQLMRLRKRIESENQKLPHLDVFKTIDTYQVQQVIHKMRLQKEQLSEINGSWKGDFARIGYLRLLHHIVCYQLFGDRWNTFFRVLNSNQEIEFSNICHVDLFEQGTWIIPKERKDTDNALNSVIEKYIKKDSIRTRDIYNYELKFIDNCYCLSNGDRITKIMFLFDTLQSGSSTTDVLKSYFECHDESIKDICKYYCNGQEVTIEQVIECNCKLCNNELPIEIVVLYGSEKGEECVQKYIEGHKWLSRGKIKIIDRINAVADQKLIEDMRTIYAKALTGNYIMRQNNYPIIREFNQPKRNVFPESCLDVSRVCSIFVKKTEFKRIRA